MHRMVLGSSRPAAKAQVNNESVQYRGSLVAYWEFLRSLSGWELTSIQTPDVTRDDRHITHAELISWFDRKDSGKGFSGLSR
jgi:hypothetical protein